MVAVLLCANIVAAGLVIRDTSPKISALLVPHSQAAQAEPLYGKCGQSAPKLAGALLSTQHPGLILQVSGPFYYLVSGTTPAEINARIAACSSVGQGEFAADTSYVINWHISYRKTNKGLCKVDKAAVGLNTRYTLPAWSDPAAPAHTTESWNAFMQHLLTHEAGHVALDKDYAEKILSTLDALPAGDCGTIATKANNAANSLVRDLDQANAQYDHTTGHGRTQGSLLE